MQMSTNSGVTIQLMVRNVGGVDAADVGLKATRADGTVVHQETIASMPAGSERMVMFSDGAQGVNQTFTIVVDPDNRIVEAFEDNNTITVTSTFIDTPSTLNGDLALNGVHTHGAVYFADPSFHLYIENNTDQSLSGITVTVRDEASGQDLYGMPYTESTVIAAHTVGPRSGNQGAEEQGIFRAPFSDPAYASQPKPTPGRHVYHVILDPNGRFAETNEANNDWRLVVNVPSGYGYWPLSNGTDTIGDTYKTDVMFQDPHIHPADRQRYVTFHGWLKNNHPGKQLVGHDLINGSDPDYPGVAKRIVPFVVKREGVPITLIAPGFDANRQINYGVTAAGKAYFILPDAGLAPQANREYLFITQEPQSTGEINYTIDLDPDNVIDEQYEGTNMGQGPIDNNHADSVVVMDPLGTPG
ncbi:MAG: hypothetical protein H0V44_13350 [Planctomycetes bacterium]|nr:hypothetical protein [Planctomycetota bacterium]